jgi:hypothetical protein
MTELKNVIINEDTRLCSFDITNIPKTDTTNIINNILRNNHETNNNTREEIMHMVHLVTEQNYFQFDK